MLNIDDAILDIDKVICSNIDMIDSGATRALVAHNVLSHSRTLVEHITLKIFGNGKDINACEETLLSANEFIKRDNKYQFLRSFHTFLQESVSHYIPNDDGAESLILKYYQYYLQIKEFMKSEFNLNLLHNINKIPLNTDKNIEEYHKKIAEKIRVNKARYSLNVKQRLYVHKIVPFAAFGEIYYEITLTPAFDTTSKFDRFVCYSSYRIPSHYSVKADLFYDDINLYGRKMPISILLSCEVSIRPCELNNYAKLFGNKIDIKSAHAEYRGMMMYLTKSGVSLLEIALSSEKEYSWIKKQMFSRSQTHYFETVLDRSRELIQNNNPGSNVIRYLLHTMNNKVIKNQFSKDPNNRLSDLRMQYGCIPFDVMPFASSLIQHIPGNSELFGCIEPEGRDHEFLARFLNENMNANSSLYTRQTEIVDKFSDVDNLIKTFNSKLYEKHRGRSIEMFGKNIYIKEAYDNTKEIIEKLIEYAKNGMQGYDESITSWINTQDAIDSEEKTRILEKMFSKSCVTLIYGAAGTGKTYLVNHISQFLDEYDKLFLANTNPAIDNLRRKVHAKNCQFLTIKKYLKSSQFQNEYDVLIIDECSMVSNKDMVDILSKTKFSLIILVGDVFQIESISFGNWFLIARYFLPRYTWVELENPYRTKDERLLKLWEKARLLSPDLTEFIVGNKFSSNLDSSIFEMQEKDEIILCLNYDGLYGINNINRFLQNNNPSKAFHWDLWTFKIGDPILFNESERFAPAIYNNLKGTIVNIEEYTDLGEIWFSIEIDKTLMAIDARKIGVELLEPKNNGKSVIRFVVKKKGESDEDKEYADESDIPFQVAYAVSIHKAQGLEYDSVKVIITRDIDEMITHNIFYTAITRTKKHLKIYWSPETMQRVISNFKTLNASYDATVFSEQSRIKKRKWNK